MRVISFDPGRQRLPPGTGQRGKKEKNKGVFQVHVFPEKCVGGFHLREKSKGETGASRPRRVGICVKTGNKKGKGEGGEMLERGAKRKLFAPSSFIKKTREGKGTKPKSLWNSPMRGEPSRWGWFLSV